MKAPWPPTLVGRLSATLVIVLSTAFVAAGLGVLLLVRYELLSNLDSQLAASAQRFASYEEATSASDNDADNRAGAGVGQVAGTLLCSRSGSTVLVGADGILTERPGAVCAGFADDEPTTRKLDGLGEYRVLAHRGVVVGLPEEPTDRSIATALAGGGLLIVAIAGLAMLTAIGSLRRQLRPLGVLADEAVSLRERVRREGRAEGLESAPQPGSPSEVAELRKALEALISEVAAALNERDESEQRLRDFMADAGHELRTPLALLRAHADLLRSYRAEVLPAELDDSLRRIDEETQRMSRLVDDLLLLVRLDQDPHVRREPVDLTWFALETVEDARLLAPDRVWRIDLPEEPVEVVGDPDQLRRLISNVVTNARVHTPSGTRISVSLTDQAVFEVGDDGPGWPASVLADEPQRFARGRNRASGSGLGLAICSAIAAAHGGSLTLAANHPGALVRVNLTATKRRT